jgi:pyridoxamine 5'-phosphate oxidase family protein
MRPPAPDGRLGTMTRTSARTHLNDTELAYLRSQRLARLATVDAKGRPQANPVGFFLRPDSTIDIGGYAMGTTRKWRNVAANPHVSLVVDDIASLTPWKVRGVEIRGTAVQVTGPHDLGPRLSPELIRITPYAVISWGLEA